MPPRLCENVTAPWDYKLYSWCHFIPLLPDHKEVSNFIPISSSPMTFCLTTIQKQWRQALRPWSQITPSSCSYHRKLSYIYGYGYANIHTCTFWRGPEYNNKIQNLFWAKSMSFWNLLGKHSKWLDFWLLLRAKEHSAIENSYTTPEPTWPQTYHVFYWFSYRWFTFIFP